MQRFLLILCFLPLFSTAQRLQTTIDPLYGDTIYSTTPKIVSRRWGLISPIEPLSASFVKHRNQNLMKVTVITNSYLPVVKRDDTLNIKFGDGKIISLKPISEFAGEPLDTKSGSIITCLYQLSADDIIDLKMKKIIVIRFNYQGKNMDYTINDESDFSKIQKAAQLLFP